MKKLLLFSLMLTTLSATSQIEQIEGIWKSNESKYLTAIFYSDGNFTFKNVGDSKLKEIVVNQGKDFVTTILKNPDNNHKVVVKYTLLNSGKIQAEFTGDYKGVVIHERYNE
jgi:hypothetical protein